jgi:hypothetical protein
MKLPYKNGAKIKRNGRTMTKLIWLEFYPVAQSSEHVIDLSFTNNMGIFLIR